MSRVTIITLSSLVLVGLVAAVTFSYVSHNWGKNNNQKLAASSKAVQAICNPTDFKDACLKSLATVESDDPKELVKAAFVSAKAELIDISKNSMVLKELEKDPKTAEAVKDCKELLQDAIDDFQRSFDEFSVFDWDQANNALENLKIWLSATRTYQETCLDGFANTTGDASLKMRKVLQTAMEMSSNGLAIVNDLSSLLRSLDMSSFNKRRLLSNQVNRRLLNNDDEGVLLQDSEQDRRRRLLTTAPIVGHHKGEVYPEWIDGFRRKLLEATKLADDDLKARANVVVAQDGSGKYKTIEESLKEIPKRGNESFIIYIKEGVYNEYLVLHKWMTNVVIVGDGPTKTRITNNKNFVDGTKTFKTATLSVLGDFFMAKDIGVENTAGAIKHQAVAFRAQTDKSIFYNCHFDGYQDTLYAHTYRQFYRDCRISGTIDFIFGDAASFFQNCTFVVRKPLENQNCIVTAQGRMERHQPTGIIIHNSKFEADPEYYPVRNRNKAYLGRPWKEFSKTIIMESQIDDLIQPQGWLPWEGTFALDTLYYGEYNNVGDGASLDDRVKWRGIKTIVHDRAQRFMPPTLFDNDDWIIASAIPYQPTLSSAPGPNSGIDEDPNAPAGAPSSFQYESSSSGSTSSHGGSSPSGGSTSTKSTTPSSSKGSSAQSDTSSSDTPTKKSTHESSASTGITSTTKTPAKGSHSSSGGEGGERGQNSSIEGGGQHSSIEGGGEGMSSQESETLDSSPTTTTTATDAPTQAPPPEEELTTPSPTPATSPSFPPFRAEFTNLIIPPMSSQKEPNPQASSPSPSESKNLKTGPLKMGELERVLMSNEELEFEGEHATPSPTSATSPISPSYDAQDTTLHFPPIFRRKRSIAPASSPSPTPSSTPSPNDRKKLRTGPLKVRELERVLMSNEEMELEDEDEASNEDMSGNIPDGDEPSPARVEPPSPSTSPSDVALSPSVSPSPSTNGPSPSPSLEEVPDWLPPAEASASAPGPDVEADKEPPVTSPKPKTNSGTKSKIELSMLSSGLIMWVALLI